MNRDNLFFILDHPAKPENIGMASRAMANFGLKGLRLVEPAGLDVAQRVARHGGFVVEGAQVFPTLESALEDLTLVVATTGLKELVGEEPLLPPQAAGQAAAASDAGRVGIVFGCERIGLTRAQVGLAERVCRVPTFPECPSMNLSHAVCLFAWELHRASGEVGTMPPEPPATWGEKRAVHAKVDEVLRLVRWEPEARRLSLEAGIKEFLERRAMSTGDAKYVMKALNLVIGHLKEKP